MRQRIVESLPVSVQMTYFFLVMREIVCQIVDDHRPIL